MKIYTKTGDAGATGLLGGVRVPKDDPRIEAYGTVDELNALIGVARSHLDAEAAELDAILERLQHQLFGVGAALATPDPAKDTSQWIDDAMIEFVETTIDRIEHHLPALTNFILPAGSPAAASLHAGRAVCRRAERRVVSLYRIPSQHVHEKLMVYLNRVGDLLFVLSRYANQLVNRPDMAWVKPDSAGTAH